MAKKNISLTTSDITPENPQHCREVLEPWVFSSMPAKGFGWRLERFLDAFHWNKKIVKKSVKSLLSSQSRKLSDYRTAKHVKKTYNRTWSSVVWPHPRKPETRKARSLAEWENEGLVLTKEGLNQMQLERIMRVVELTKPAKVLEVGAGMGLNLLTLAAVFPDIEFAGIELTEAGVERAKSVQEEEQLPDVIAAYSPYDIKDASAHRKIDFHNGDATNMPFEDNSFDLVYSRLAVEQMENVRDEAITEMARVSRDAVLMVEPFADFNQDRHRNRAIKAKNYFSLFVDDMSRYGLKTQAVFGNWPQKLSEGIGLAYFKKQ